MKESIEMFRAAWEILTPGVRALTLIVIGAVIGMTWMHGVACGARINEKQGENHD